MPVKLLTTLIIVLTDKLRACNAALCFIQIVVNWHRKLGAAVRWNGVLP